jgi:hypothetical protein
MFAKRKIATINTFSKQYDIEDLKFAITARPHVGLSA